MTRLVSVRVVCDGCRTAQALVYCVGARRALCALCSRGHTSSGRVDLARAITALPFCDRCDSAPAAVYCALEDVTLCACCDVETQSPQNSSGSSQTRGIQPALEQRSVRFSASSVSRPRSAELTGGMHVSLSVARQNEPMYNVVGSKLRLGPHMASVLVKGLSSDPQGLPRQGREPLQQHQHQHQHLHHSPGAQQVSQAQIHVPSLQAHCRPRKVSIPAAPPPSPLLGPAHSSGQPMAPPETLPVSGFLPVRLSSMANEFPVQPPHLTTLDDTVCSTPGILIGGAGSSPTPDMFDISKYLENAAPSPSSGDHREDVKKRIRAGPRMRKPVRAGENSVGTQNKVKVGRHLSSSGQGVRVVRCSRNGLDDGEEGGNGCDISASKELQDVHIEMDVTCSSDVSDGSRNGSGSSRQSFGAAPSGAPVPPAIAAAATVAAGERYLLSSAEENGGGDAPPPDLNPADLHSAAASALAAAAAGITSIPAREGGGRSWYAKQRIFKPRVESEQGRHEHGPSEQEERGSSGSQQGPEWGSVSYPSGTCATHPESSAEPNSKDTSEYGSKSVDLNRNVGGSTVVGSSTVGNGSTIREIVMPDFGGFEPLDLTAFEQQQHHQQQLHRHQELHRHQQVQPPPTYLRKSQPQYPRQMQPVPPSAANLQQKGSAVTSSEWHENCPVDSSSGPRARHAK